MGFLESNDKIEIMKKIVEIDYTSGGEHKTLAIGGGELVIAAGPCSIENRGLLIEIAKRVKAVGAVLLRAGAFKPRTRPSSFQGLGLEALEYLKEAGALCGLPTVTEAVSVELVGEVAARTDMIQIGSRNMYNYPLLRAVGKTGKPVLLKRAFSATVDEWIGAAEYIGHDKVVFCERGIRSFSDVTRNVLDLASAKVVSEITGLPVIVDPSHATGRRDLVKSMALAAVAAGADGLIIEAHIDPPSSVSDADQTVYIEELADIIEKAQKVQSAVTNSGCK